MTTPLLIGLAGRAGTGKDAVGERLRRDHLFMVFSFAAPIKEAVCAAFGLNAAQTVTKKEEVIDWIGKSPRQIFQLLGTEFGRELIHPDIWIRSLERDLERLRSHGLALRSVITDVRYPNEAAWIRAQGQLWHIRRRAAEPVNAHGSEAGIDPLPGETIIDNDGNLDDLAARIRALISRDDA